MSLLSFPTHPVTDRLSLSEEKSVEQRQAAAMHIAMAQQRASTMMRYPHIMSEIRDLRLEGNYWKDVTREMKEPLLDAELARKKDFTIKRLFKSLTGTVSKAHNDRKKYDEDIGAIKAAIENDPAFKDLVIDIIEQKGNLAAPLRIAEVRTKFVTLGLRPRNIDPTDARFKQGTLESRPIQIRNFNYLAKVALAEVFYTETIDAEFPTWNDDAE